jgi:hypothetical protein
VSSLLQFDGAISRRGVRLEFYQTSETERWYKHSATLAMGEPSSPIMGAIVEPVQCEACGRSHARLYTAWRKPKGTMGHWVVFRVNGKDTVPDLSTPIATFRLPRDARPMTDAENSVAWHRS